MVYFIMAPSGLVKIGTTSRLVQRLDTLSAENGCGLTVLGVVHGSNVEESALHKRFGHHRQHGEWFAAGDDLMEYIAGVACPWDASWDEARDRATVKIDRGLVKRARVLAGERGLGVADYVESVLQDQVAADWAAGWEGLAKPTGYASGATTGHLDQ